MQYMKLHPEKFLYEGIKEKLNVQAHDIQFNTYYGSTILRCVPVLDFINNRYIETNYNQSSEADILIDSLNPLFRFHHNPVSYVYNALLYYNNKFESVTMGAKQKKQRLLNILKSIRI